MLICNIYIHEKLVSTLAFLLLDCGVKFKSEESFNNAIVRLYKYLNLDADATNIEITEDIKNKVVEFCNNPHTAPITDDMCTTLYPNNYNALEGGIFFDEYRDWITLGSNETFDIPAKFIANEVVNGSNGSIGIGILLKNRNTGAETYKTITITSGATWKDISYCTVQLKASSSSLYAYVSYYTTNDVLIGTENNSVSSASFKSYDYKFVRLGARVNYNTIWFLQPLVGVDNSNWFNIGLEEYTHAGGNILRVGDVYNAGAYVYANLSHYPELIPVNTHVKHKYINNRPVKYVDLYDITIREDVYYSLVYLLICAGAKIASKEDMLNVSYGLFSLIQKHISISNDRHIVITEEVNNALISLKNNHASLFKTTKMTLTDGWYPIVQVNPDDDLASIPFSLEDEFMDYRDRLETSFDFPYRFYLEEEKSSYEAYIVYERQHKETGEIDYVRIAKNGSNTSKTISYMTIRRYGNDEHGTFNGKFNRYNSADVLQGTYNIPAINALDMTKYNYKMKLALFDIKDVVIIKEYRTFNFHIPTECVENITELIIGDRYRASGIREDYPLTEDCVIERYYNGEPVGAKAIKNSFNAVIKDVVSYNYTSNTDMTIVKVIKNSFKTKFSVINAIKNNFNTMRRVYMADRVRFNAKISVVKSCVDKYNVKIADVISSKTKFNSKYNVIQQYKNKHNSKISIRCYVKNTHNTKVIQNKGVKTKHNVKFKIAKIYKNTYNSKINVVIPYKTAFNTSKITISDVRNVFNVKKITININKTTHSVKITDSVRKQYTYNIVINNIIASKTAHNVKNTDVRLVKNRFNTSITLNGIRVRNEFKTEIIADLKVCHSVNLNVVNTCKTPSNTRFSIVKQWYKRHKFNTVISSYMHSRMLFNTLRETDVLSLVKSLLNITNDNSKDGIIKWYMEEARYEIAEFTNRDIAEIDGILDGLIDGEIPQKILLSLVIDITVWKYRMRGMEHLKAEGIENANWSYHHDMPPAIQRRLKPYKKWGTLNVY